MASLNQDLLAEALGAIEKNFPAIKPVRQSTQAEMAAARRAAQAPRDAETAPKVARLAAAPADMSGLTDDQISSLIYTALAFYPKDAGYDLAQEVSTRAHAERTARAEAIKVPLSRGQVALVDEEDFDRVSALSWYANPTSYDPNKFYAVTSVARRTTYLHRFITGAPNNLLVDHRNRNTLDCRRANLRLATRVQNNVNRVDRTTQPFRGLERRDYCRLLWNARIQVAGKVIRSERFATAEAAARAYDAMAREHYGEFAMLNFPAEA